MRESTFEPARQSVFLRTRYFQKPPGDRYHLYRVERGNCPLKCLGFSDRVAGQQDFAFSCQMKQTGTALEHSDFTVVEIRHLSERLPVKMVGFAVFKWNCTNFVRQARFFTCPSQSQVKQLIYQAFF